jgi:hypothetical protein
VTVQVVELPPELLEDDDESVEAARWGTVPNWSPYESVAATVPVAATSSLTFPSAAVPVR